MALNNVMAGTGDKAATGGGGGIFNALGGGAASVIDTITGNPNLARMLLQLGGSMDPQGPAGAISQAGQGMLTRDMLAKALSEGRGAKVGADGSIELPEVKNTELAKPISSDGQSDLSKSEDQNLSTEKQIGMENTSFLQNNQNQDQGLTVQGLEKKMFDSIYNDLED